MLILYKNDRNVRFMLFTKTSNGGSRISRGLPFPKVGTRTYYLAKYLPKTAWNEKILTERGSASLKSTPHSHPPTPHPECISEGTFVLGKHQHEKFRSTKNNLKSSHNCCHKYIRNSASPFRITNLTRCWKYCDDIKIAWEKVHCVSPHPPSPQCFSR